MSTRHKTILSVSPDLELSRTRHDALSRGGFEVISVHSEVAAQYEIQFGRCGVLILCHKLSSAARRSLARDFDTRCQEPFIVAILAHPAGQYPAQAHVCVLHTEGSGPLLKVLQEKLAA
jgi:hypothetical protein